MKIQSDHIVEEVRKIREELASKLNHDIRLIVADAQKRQKFSGHTLVDLRPSKEVHNSNIPS